MAEEQPAEVGKLGKSAILGLGILPAMGLAPVSIMLPAIGEAFQRSPEDLMIKSISTALGLGMFLGAPLGGYLLDRIGRRNALAIGAGVFGTFGTAMAVMDSLYLLIGARFIMGIAAVTMAIGLGAVIGDLFTDKDRNKWMGFSNGVAPLATIIIIPLIGMLTDMHWQLGFLPLSLSFIVMAMVIGGIPKVTVTNVAARAGKVRQSLRERIASLVRFLKQVPISILLLAIIMGTLTTGTSLYWPYRLAEFGETSTTMTALVAVPQILAIAAVAFSYGWFRKFLSVPNVFVVGALLSTAGLLIIAVSTGPVMMAAGLVVEGMGIGFLTPNLTILALSLTNATYRGRIIGLVKAANYGSPFVTQFILYPFDKAAGAAGAIAGIAGMAFLIAAFVWIGWAGKPREAAS